MSVTRRNRRNVPDPNLAVAYLRVSTEEQKYGPDAQRAAIRDWARANDKTVVSWHLDELSGSTSAEDRPGLAAALASVRANRAGELVVGKRDRLARSADVVVDIERQLAVLGVRVVSADGAGNGDSPADEFMRHMLYGVAQFERAMIRARIREALAVKKSRGERLGRPRYGWRVDPVTRVLTPVAAEQAVIEAVLSARRSGATQRQISEALDLHLTTVSRILQAATKMANLPSAR